MPPSRPGPARGRPRAWRGLLLVATALLICAAAAQPGGGGAGFELAPPLTAASGGFLGPGRSEALDEPGARPASVAAQAVGQAEAALDGGDQAVAAAGAGGAAGAADAAAAAPAQSAPPPPGELVQGARGVQT
jgi:hypothetical protein